MQDGGRDGSKTVEGMEAGGGKEELEAESERKTGSVCDRRVKRKQ